MRGPAWAFGRAVDSHNGIKEVFALTKDIDNCFGHSEGQILYRAVSSELGEGSSSQKLPRVGGTRKAGALSGVSAKLVAHFKRISVALETRLAWRRSRRGRFTLESLAETSRRLREPSFVVLLICFQDICRPISEHILTVQTTLEPWLVHRADEKCLNSIDELLDGIDRAEKFLCVCCLLAQWSSAADRGSFFVAHLFVHLFHCVQLLYQDPDACRFGSCL